MMKQTGVLPLGIMALFTAVTTHAAAEPTVARYAHPTDIYGHGAVEDGEFATLEVTTASGQMFDISYANGVFEGPAPFVYDLDGDGVAEIIATHSTFDQGARVQIFAQRDTGLVPIGSTAPIGQRNRWLAIAGFADFNQDGVIDIAYVDRPHLAKVLRVVSARFAGDQLTLSSLGTQTQLSNHHYKSPQIEGGVRACEGQLPVIMTANSDWTQVVATKWNGQGLVSTPVAAYHSSDSFTPFLECE